MATTTSLEANFEHYENEILGDEFYASEFDRHYQVSAPDFWRRFGGQPDVKGKRVFDFGSGSGGMIHRLMEAGASSAVGVDLDLGASQYAKKRLAQEWGDKVEIYSEDIRTVDFAPVDLIVSQNTMEHVSPLDEVLDAVVQTAAPGAELYFGYAPLWYSPYGHHHCPPTKIPWLHLMKGDQIVLDHMFERFGRRYPTVKAAGFNCKTPTDFRRAFGNQPLELLSLRRNPGSGGLRSVVNRLGLLPANIAALEKYFTTGMYWHLRKLP